MDKNKRISENKSEIKSVWIKRTWEMKKYMKIYRIAIFLKLSSSKCPFSRHPKLFSFSHSRYIIFIRCTKKRFLMHFTLVKNFLMVILLLFSCVIVLLINNGIWILSFSCYKYLFETLFIFYFLLQIKINLYYISTSLSFF